MKKKGILASLMTLVCCFYTFGQQEAFNFSEPWSFGKIVATVFVLFIAFVMLLIFFKVITSMIQAKRDGSGGNAEDPAVQTFKTSSPSSSKETSEDVYAAITMALYESDEDVHDIESTILTLKSDVTFYSPWSSKIYGLREPLQRQ